MPLSRCILRKQDLTGFECSLHSQRRLNFDLAIEQDDKLSLGCAVKIPVITGVHFAKDHLPGVYGLGKMTDTALADKWNLNVLKMALSFCVSVNAYYVKHLV